MYHYTPLDVQNDILFRIDLRMLRDLDLSYALIKLDTNGQFVDFLNYGTP